ncbi:MAG: PKD domain-containing protein [Deltaproteobacteria bacterium]|nr:PKD domain-containing protein [Deltaproteobacteria bacterium]
MSTSPPRRRRLLLALGALVLGLLIFLLVGSRDKPQQMAAPGPRRVAGGVVRIPEVAPAARPQAFDPRTLPELTDHEPKPVIDEIMVEKKEVCEGEENLVTVRAHTTNGTDTFLHYTIGSYAGAAVPVRSWLDHRGKTPAQYVQVFGRNNVAAYAEIPEFTVKKCKPNRAAYVTAHLRENTFGEFDFRAQVVDMGAKDNPDARPLKPVRYSWSFGDDTTEVTEVPVVTHSYENRAQDSMYSYFMVTVVVEGEGGEKVIGRMNHALMNPAFEDLAYKGIVVLFTSLNPRFAEVSEDGNVNQGVRIWHVRPEPVTIEKVTVKRYYVPAKETGEDEFSEEKGDVWKILGQNLIPAGPGLEIVAAENARAERNWLYVTYLLEGKSADGFPASGAFSVMMPTKLPTKDDHEPVTDPMLVARIVAAQRILGKQMISDYDLQRLEAEGRFENLKPHPADKIRNPAPPPTVPPPPSPPEGPMNTPEGPAPGEQPAPPVGPRATGLDPPRQAGPPVGRRADALAQGTRSGRRKGGVRRSLQRMRRLVRGCARKRRVPSAAAAPSTPRKRTRWPPRAARRR